jgi:hypothetical protein
MSSFILQTWQDGTVLSRQYDILEEKCDLFRLKGHQLHLSILFTRDKYEGTYVSIFAIVMVLLSGIPLISDDAINFADARYTNTQTQANANECNTGTNCAINSPQTHGDGSLSSPTNLQISRFNEEQEEIGEEPNPGAKGFVEVQKIVICPTAGSFTMNVDVSESSYISRNSSSRYRSSRY